MAEYQIREWDNRGGLIRELAVCRDAGAAYGALEAAAFNYPRSYFTMGRDARILHSRGPDALIPDQERKLLAGPGEA